jgi:ferredoxin
MKVSVDQDKCVSSGQCVLNASELFDQRDDDDGVVVLLQPSPSSDQSGNARRAAAACPALAIDIEE